jgi:hypothetical protein
MTIGDLQLVPILVTIGLCTLALVTLIVLSRNRRGP